jgi:hypothetical protein
MGRNSSGLNGRFIRPNVENAGIDNVVASADELALVPFGYKFPETETPPESRSLTPKDRPMDDRTFRACLYAAAYPHHHYDVGSLVVLFQKSSFDIGYVTKDGAIPTVITNNPKIKFEDAIICGGLLRAMSAEERPLFHKIYEKLIERLKEPMEAAKFLEATRHGLMNYFIINPIGQRSKETVYSH